MSDCPFKKSSRLFLVFSFLLWISFSASERGHSYSGICSFGIPVLATMNKPLAAEYTFAQFSPQKSLRAQPKTSSVIGGSVLNALCLLFVWVLTIAVSFI